MNSNAKICPTVGQSVMNLKELRKRVEGQLSEAFSDFFSQFEETRLEQALEYGLQAGGKRIRPTIVAGVAESYGAEAGQWIGFASALEAVHCGSLIHDDLPMLDDDDVRRGRPSCHIKFGEAVALLAGDAILPLANILILKYSQGVSDPVKLNLLTLISDSTYEVCRGQVRDVELMKELQAGDKETLISLHQEKTGALFKAAFAGGGLVARVSSDEQSRLGKIGERFGLFFQLADDLDDFSEEGEQGGEDMVNLVKLLGEESARKRLDLLRSEINTEAESTEVKALVKSLFDLVPT